LFSVNLPWPFSFFRVRLIFSDRLSNIAQEPS
jgi:hypothetical protein